MTAASTVDPELRLGGAPDLLEHAGRDCVHADHAVVDADAEALPVGLGERIGEVLLELRRETRSGTSAR